MASRQRDDGEASGIAGTLNEGVELLARLAKAGRADFDELKRRADTLTLALQDKRRAARDNPGRLRDRLRAVDEWTLDIFRSTESALPRETLLQDFQTRYRRERRTVDHERHAGPWMFVFRADPAERAGVPTVHAHSAQGVHPQAFAQLCAEHLPQAAADPFLAPVMLEHRDVEGWHGAWFGGSALFDRLLDIKQRFANEPDYWVTGTALPGSRHGPAVGLFVLHANAGDLLAPEPPSTMRQDQRLLMALSLAWRQLEHQVKAFAALTEQDRRELLNLIGPGLLHHELGTTLRSLYGQAFEQFHLLQDAAGQQPAPWLDNAVHYAHSIATLALRGQHITDVFNNLDKRGQLETATLDQLLSDVQTLLHHRLGHAGTELQWNRAEASAQLTTTDVVLLQQAMINIVINALNALREGGTPAPRFIVVQIEATTDLLAVAICNNGPAVPGDLVRDIFRRGYTTRAGGHGQGLYLVRLITHYLGGEVSLIDRAALPATCHAGFRLQWQRRLAAQEGLARAVAE